MDAAALLLVSAVGVAFGWQPMPDGSQQYEYIVQLEPELAQTLAEGRSIPIVSDVPPEVQPIGRIRVVVGREEPPRQRLVTRLKPASGGGGQDSAVELAQYSRYADDRYSAAPPQQPPATAPPADRVAAATHPYSKGQSQPPQGAGETAWNSAQQDEPPITPTESTPSPQQLFGGAAGSGNAWNADARIDSAANAAAQAVSQLGNQLQQNAQPLIQNGAQQIDAQVQAAADKFGDRTRGLLNELRQPFQQPQASANGQQPPASATTNSAGEQAWNQDQQDNSQAATTNPLRGDQQVGSTWNNEQPQSAQADPRNTATSTSSTGEGPQPGAASIHWNPSAGSQVAGGDRGTPQQPGQDPWAGVPDPRAQAGAGGANGDPSNIPGVATRPLPYGGLGSLGSAAGPEFPNVQNPPTASQNAGQTAAAQPGTGSQTTTGAEVRSDMLQQPSDRPLDGTTTPVTTAPAPTTSGTTPATTTWGSPAQPPTAASSAATANAPSSGAPAADPAERASSHAAMVLFAWVMLTGSVAGNFYLFWSYLDVRQKYRSLVRKTARAVGSRFSAA